MEEGRHRRSLFDVMCARENIPVEIPFGDLQLRPVLLKRTGTLFDASTIFFLPLDLPSLARFFFPNEPP